MNRGDFEEEVFETNIIEKRLDENCKMQIISKKELNVQDFDIDIDQETQGIRKYKFTLDHFQKAAVLSIGNFRFQINFQKKIEVSWWQPTLQQERLLWQNT